MAKGNGSTRAGRSNNPRGLNTADGVRSFLLNYTPASQGFTSNEEIELISQRLGLNDMDEEQLRNMRDRAVTIYRDAMDKEINYDADGNYAGRTEKYWDYSEGMMSVTAVIDYVRNRKGTSVAML